MNMLNAIRNILTAGIAAVALAACGGSGGGGGGGNSPIDVTPNTSLSGTASKGIIYPGTVSIYGIDGNGVKSTAPLVTVPTDSKGRFTADLGQYAGALIVEAAGEYTDEAAGTKVTIAPASPLRALVDGVDGIVLNYRAVAVTPLTELAYGMAADLKPASITAANQRVGELFKIGDIIAIQPVKDDAASMGAAGVTTEQQAYTMALAALSQMARNKSAGTAASFDQIKTLVNGFKADISASSTAGLGRGNATAFTSALASVASRPDMATFTKPAANLSGVGAPIMKLTLAAGSIPAGTQLGSLKATITLPPGVSIPAGANGMVSDGLIVPAVAAAGSGAAIAAGNYNEAGSKLVVSLASVTGFGNGDCATITVNVPPGSSLKASDFSMTLNEAKDAGPTYAAITGVTASLK